MIENHPFGIFIPKDTTYLFLGTYPGRIVDTSNDWFFGTKRNQFWPIMEKVYDRELKSKTQKQQLLTELRMAMSDVIMSCERSQGNNSDNNLVNITYNETAINNAVINYKLKAIYFSSRLAEKLFKKAFKELVLKFPDVRLVVLPSPSPRYAAMTKDEKVRRYMKLLPKMGL